MRKLMALGLLMMSASGCATAVSNSGACPHVKEYSKETLSAAADEIDALPDGSVLGNIMMPDYGVLRAGARECWKAAAK